MGIFDKAKQSVNDTTDSAKDKANDLENKAHEKKGEAEGRLKQSDQNKKQPKQ